MKKEVGSGPDPVVRGTGTDLGIRIRTKMGISLQAIKYRRYRYYQAERHLKKNIFLDNVVGA
jgi:hypothetical protein